MGPPRWRARRALAAACAAPCAASAVQCAGSLQVDGYDPVQVVNAKWNQPGEPIGQVSVQDDQVIAYMSGRSYFADACAEGVYDHGAYSAWSLLGKTLRFTTHLAGASCGCNAALYLVSMRQNPEVSDCEDYYCDANSVCGVRCAEIDIQEANSRAWRSTLHVADDGGGAGAGLGGGMTSFTPEEYGPGARCIDTLLPFQVSVSFPVDSTGALQAMEVTLSQELHDCPLTLRVADYAVGNDRDGLAELTGALAEGMAPVISYWKSEDMGWLDGGPCDNDDTSDCGESVRFFGFSVSQAGERPEGGAPPDPEDTAEPLAESPAAPLADPAPAAAGTTQAPAAAAAAAPAASATAEDAVPPPTPVDDGAVEAVTDGAEAAATAGGDEGGTDSDAEAVTDGAEAAATAGGDEGGTDSDAEADQVFNCEDGLENWQWEWSPVKMDWCCKWKSQGCSTPSTSSPERPATDPPTGAPTPAPSAAHAPEPEREVAGEAAAQPSYDCEAGGAATREWIWPAEQRGFCCQEQGMGCTTTAPPGAGEKPHVGRPFESSATGLADREVSVEGHKRPFSLYMPAPCGSTGGNMPLWVLAPGTGNDPETQLRMSGLLPAADRSRFVVAALRGRGDSMNVEAHARADDGGPDDVAYALAVVRDVRKNFCVDGRRVYCAGFSRGARFCSRAASELSGTFAAVAGVGGLRYPQPNNATRPVPVLAIHGTGDSTNPYFGSDEDSPGYWHSSVPAAVSQWAKFNGCSQKGSARPGAGVSVEVQSECRSGADVVLFTVENGGHTWPGSDYDFEPEMGHVTHEIDATDVIAKFFAGHSLEVDEEQPADAPAASGPPEEQVRRGRGQKSLAVHGHEAGLGVGSLAVGLGVLFALAVLILAARSCWRGAGGSSSIHRLVQMSDNEEIRLKVVDIAGRRTLHIVAASWASVESLKEQISAENKVPIDQQSLFFGGRTLMSSEQIGSLGMTDLSTVYVARHLKIKPLQLRKSLWMR